MSIEISTNKGTERNKVFFKTPENKEKIKNIINVIIEKKIPFETGDRAGIASYINYLFPEEGIEIFKPIAKNCAGYSEDKIQEQYVGFIEIQSSFPKFAKTLLNNGINVNDHGIEFSFENPKEDIVFIPKKDKEEKVFSPKEIFNQVQNTTSKKENAIQNKSIFDVVEDYLETFYEFRNDVVGNKIECRKTGEEAWQEINENNIYRELQKRNFRINQSNLLAILKSDFVKKFNPLHDYFENLPAWNGKTDFIQDLAQYIKLKSDQDRNRFDKQFKKMLIRCIACGLNDVVHNKHAFVLVHDKQSSGKTFFVRWLCRPKGLIDYYRENLPTDLKDADLELSSNFFINLDELASLNKHEINNLKTIFSKENVKQRPPYGSKQILAPRRANFIGSTNNDEFLTDVTGSVRWLCFEIDSIDWNYSKNININDVWAQAYHLYKNGFKYELTREELEENEKSNNDFHISTPEMDIIQKHYTPGNKENHDAFYNASDMTNELSQKSGSAKLNYSNVGKALKKLGFNRDQKFNGTYQIKGYYVKFVNSPDLLTYNNETALIPKEVTK